MVLRKQLTMTNNRNEMENAYCYNLYQDSFDFSDLPTDPLLSLLILDELLNGGAVKVPLAPGQEVGHLLLVGQPCHVLHRLDIDPAVLSTSPKGGHLLHRDDAAIVLCALLLSRSLADVPEPAGGFRILLLIQTKSKKSSKKEKEDTR